MCENFEENDDCVYDLEFLIAQLVGDITEEQVTILTELKNNKSIEEKKEES